MREEHRITCHIAATQVQQPRNIVQTRQQMHCRAVPVQRAAHAGELVTARGVDIGRRMSNDRCLRQPWALGPGQAGQIEIDPQRRATFVQRVLQPLLRGR